MSSEIFLEKLVSGKQRVENDIQSDIYAFLTLANLNLDEGDLVSTEVPTSDGTGRRIDVETGRVCIEVKRDLRKLKQKSDGEHQLFGYLESKQLRGLGAYAGMLTDGQSWHLYRMQGEGLVQIGQLDLNASNRHQIYPWLQSVFATQERIIPTPEEMISRLGETSPAYLLDSSQLKKIYLDVKDNPEVVLKRQLWVRLLTTALGTAFSDTDEMFVAHTLLVLQAEMIGHEAVGFNPNDLAVSDPQGLVSGVYFEQAQIFGVVHNDFFDWPLQSLEGIELLRTLARRIGQFDWSNVRHDVLKVLYESVISAEQRAALGEYYTPDWLADRMVESVLSGKPDDTKVLDPSCGSGTFLLQAIKHKLASLDKTDLTPGQKINIVCNSVFGIDIHPVAVALARVTYILALGTDALRDQTRGLINVPVFLGDSLQWDQSRDLFSEREIHIRTDTTLDLIADSSSLFSDDLVLPLSALRDLDLFDALVRDFTERAMSPISLDQIRKIVSGWSLRMTLDAQDQIVLQETLLALRRLNEEGRNHIWSYYIRNLIRPIWFSKPDNHVDVLIGNPPWLRYTKMPKVMQERFLELMGPRGLAQGGQGSTGRDLSVLFVSVVSETFLRPEGAFAFVMPHGVLTRRPHKSFRTGLWNIASDFYAAFEESWDLAGAATGFPHPAVTIFGHSGVLQPKPADKNVLNWKTTGAESDVSWEEMQGRTSVTPSRLEDTSDFQVEPSKYQSYFRNGAVLHPRMLTHVERKSANPLGSGAGRALVTSWRSKQEKKPYSDVAPIVQSVSEEFIFPVIHGQDSGPFRVMSQREVVLPISLRDGRLLSQEEIDTKDGLRAWWNEAESLFKEYGKDRETLLERVDYFKQLSSQFPVANFRVVYAKAGSTLSASRVCDSNLLIDHKLYWAPLESFEEAGYLTAILNSRALIDIVRPFQAVGNFGVRDIDKNAFRAPIPIFDPSNPTHRKLSELATQCEDVANDVTLNPASSFQKNRRQILKQIEEGGFMTQIDAIAFELLKS
jgi:hypothetical protein